MICPHCQRELATAVSFCPFCGKEILFPCPHCKAYIAPQDVICPNCGRGRGELPSSQMAQAERYVPRLAAEVRPRILASKLMQENYPPFFQITAQGPLIGALLFGPQADHRIVAAAMTFAAMVQLIAEGFCTLDVIEPNSDERMFNPVPDRRWDGQIDALETALYRHSAARADETVEGVLQSLYTRNYETIAPSTGDRLVNMAIGRGLGIPGMIAGFNAPPMRREVYDTEVVNKLHLLVHDCPMPAPPDRNAACATLYDLLLRFYHHDTVGATWLAKAIAGLVM